MTDRPHTPVLDRVTWPADLRRLSDAELKQCADELRAETISAVSETGGHLGSSLGVVELTVAIHAVFNTPYDKLVWDVGHQCYPHKIVTGRRDRIRTLRQKGGLSGFTKRSESDYCPFGAARIPRPRSRAALVGNGHEMLTGRRVMVPVISALGSLARQAPMRRLNQRRPYGRRSVGSLNATTMSFAVPSGGECGGGRRLSEVCSRGWGGLPRRLRRAPSRTDSVMCAARASGFVPSAPISAIARVRHLASTVVSACGVCVMRCVCG